MKQIRDHYFKKAKREHYLARSVYKLAEIDHKYRIFSKGLRVLDIGCAPGSWSQYILQHIGEGSVVGMDLADGVAIGDSRFSYIQADLLEENIERTLSVQRYDVIVSDAAPKTTGNGFTDAQASLRLVERVFSLAESVLNNGGTAVAKVFQGEDLKGFVEGLKKRYRRVSLFKPKSSRAESRELFIIAQERGKLR
jgi:23S rRNA (uridine2552-2'-O)-methyltransferase